MKSTLTEIGMQRRKDSKGKMGNLILNRWNLILASERDAKRGVI